MDGSGSRVMMMGDLSLFLDPGGRPRGRRRISIEAPSFWEGSVLEGLVGWSWKVVTWRGWVG